MSILKLAVGHGRQMHVYLFTTYLCVNFYFIFLSFRFSILWSDARRRWEPYAYRVCSVPIHWLNISRYQYTVSAIKCSIIRKIYLSRKCFRTFNGTVFIVKCRRRAHRYQNVAHSVFSSLCSTIVKSTCCEYSAMRAARRETAKALCTLITNA